MNRRPVFVPIFLALLFAAEASAALAQDKGSVDPKPLPPLANPNDPTLAAKELFARKLLPAAMPTQVVATSALICGWGS